MEKLLHKHVFTFNPKDNGGESVVLTTTYFDNGDREQDGSTIFGHQELTLHAYGRSASFNLGVLFTPENLRNLANELESSKIQATKKLTETLPQYQAPTRTIIVDTEDELKRIRMQDQNMAEFIFVRETNRIVKDRYDTSPRKNICA
jgi:hypothetical protein